MMCGAAALFGIPGRLPALKLETDALTYVDPRVRVAQDTRRFEESNGLDVIDLWLQTPPGHALDPDFLRAVESLTRTLEQHAGVDAVDGPTSVLRWAKYIESGIGPTIPLPGRLAQAGGGSGEHPPNAARCAQFRRRHGSQQRAHQHPRTRRRLRAGGGHAGLRRIHLG